ncbi:S8 family peptidase [Pedobacter sp. P351]|uniref:S8 family peptidase n=1 Tax=Pedobacter superstes TaxID=3133441 RepID=UPI0030A8E49C
MKKPLIILSLLLYFIASQAQDTGIKNNRIFKFPPGITSNDYIPGRIILKFKAGVESSSKSLSSIPKLKSAVVISMDKKFPETYPENKTYSRGQKDPGLNRIFELVISTSADIEKVITELLTDPNIDYAEPVYINHINYIANDPRYLSGEQQFLNIVRAPLAWDLIRDASGIIIGIVDSGSELAHQDLAANIYYNIADPVNGFDDDGDGFTDNYAGWDFVGATANNIKADNNPNVVAANNDHGVHVSGLASAVTDNGVGVASIAMNAKLLIVKAGPDDSGADIYKGYEGVKYAADKGARIINCSWGSKSASSFGRDVVDYALNKGCLIVAAAGNTGANQPEYPAAYQGVFAVANTDNTDRKSPSSNYGDYVTLSAPGSSLLSTTFNNGYGVSTGTSMSAPVVASAAALVKAYFPLLSMPQVGELLRVTADNIDSRNPSYIGLLGKGRLNVFNALTQTSPSVRLQKITEEEHHSSNVQLSDTLYLYLDLKNFLFPAANLKISLSTANSAVTVLIPEITIPSLSTLESRSLVGPFKVAVSPGTSTNTAVSFRLDYAANNNAYQDFEKFSVIVAKDYIDIHTNSVTTTLSSTGRIGFSAPLAEAGAGFLYKGNQLLYEASLMIGNSSGRVSNNARGVNDQSDEHFIKVVRAHELVNNSDSIKAEAQFDDTGNPDRLFISVKQQVIGYKSAPHDKYIISEYEITNTTNFLLKNVHVGLFTDFDIFGGVANVTQFDPSSRLGYVYDKQQVGPYAAIKLLNQNAPFIYYPLSYNIVNNPLSDNDLTIAEKWETLSNGVKELSMGTTTSGIDVSFVSGNGPYDIPANSSIKVAFAVIGGDNLQDIKASGNSAQEKYNLLSARPPQEPITKVQLNIYPNPVLTSESGLSILRFALPESGIVTLELCNVMGQTVRTLVSNQPYGNGVHYLNYDFAGGNFADIGSGIYFYRLIYNNQLTTSKISILR